MITRYSIDPSELVGKIFKKIEINLPDKYNHFRQVRMYLRDSTKGERYTFLHRNAEEGTGLSLRGVLGDIGHLYQSKVISVEKEFADLPPLYDAESAHIWTIYTITTEKGRVIFRWYGYPNIQPMIVNLDDW